MIRFCEACAGVTVGDPFSEATMTGPMTGPRHLERVRAFLDHACQADVTVNGDDLKPPTEGGFWSAPS